jgi:hypothetical protein
MNRRVLALAMALGLIPVLGTPVPAADDSQAKAAAREVEAGAKKLVQGVEDTAKGVGKTIEEGQSWPATRSWSR